MQEQCGICFSKFNKYRHAPFFICHQQHLICFSCRVNFSKHYQEPKCPFCRIKIHSKNIFSCKLYDQCNQHVEYLSQRYKIVQKSCDSEFIFALNDFFSFQSNTDQELHVICLELQIRKKMKFQNYKEAKIIIKKIIEEYPDKICQEKLIGLGSKAEWKFYGKSDFASYWDRYNFPRSLCDSLAICCLYDDSYKEDKKWYEKIITKYPSLYQIVFGLAILEHNQGNNFEAQKLYQQVIKIQGSCDKAYEMLAFLSVQSNKSKQYAMESFKITGKFNVFTEYFLAMCGQNDKPEKLSKIIEKYPDYVQPRLQLFQFHRMKGNRQNTVASYLSYIEYSLDFNGLQYLFHLLHSGQTQMQLYKQTLPILLNIMDTFEDLLANNNRENIICWISQCLAKTQSGNLAIQWMDQFWQDKFYPVNIVQTLINQCKSLQTKEVISIFQTKTKGVLGFKDLNLSTKLKIVASYVIQNRDDQAFECAKSEVDLYEHQQLFEQIQNQKNERRERTSSVRFSEDQ